MTVKQLERVLTVLGLALFLYLGFLVYRHFNPPAPILPVKPDTAYITISKESKAVAETTHSVVTRFRTRVDSVIRTDTTRDTVFLRSLDTVFARCERCARQLDSLRKFTDSAMKAKDDTIYVLRVRVEKCRGSRPWWAVGGLALGTAGCRAVR